MKRNIDILHQEFERITLTTEKTLEEFSGILMAGVEAQLRELQLTIEEQKEDNAKLQSQATELRKEHSEIQQRILMGKKKGEFLYESLGNYNDN